MTVSAPVSRTLATFLFGSCLNDSKYSMTRNLNINFQKNHILVYRVVLTLFGSPVKFISVLFHGKDICEFSVKNDPLVLR